MRGYARRTGVLFAQLFVPLVAFSEDAIEDELCPPHPLSPAGSSPSVKIPRIACSSALRSSSPLAPR
jgi:hypothetical protein